MRAAPGEYLNLRLRAHELLHDVPVYDVSVVDLPGGGAGRNVADTPALESAAAPSRIANALYGVRHVLGRLFDWDRVAMRPEESLCRVCPSGTVATPRSPLAPATARSFSCTSSRARP
jgi:hypothetical protein